MHESYELQFRFLLGIAELQQINYEQCSEGANEVGKQTLEVSLHCFDI